MASWCRGRRLSQRRAVIPMPVGRPHDRSTVPLADRGAVGLRATRAMDAALPDCYEGVRWQSGWTSPQVRWGGPLLHVVVRRFSSLRDVDRRCATSRYPDGRRLSPARGRGGGSAGGCRVGAWVDVCTVVATGDAPRGWGRHRVSKAEAVRSQVRQHLGSTRRLRTPRPAWMHRRDADSIVAQTSGGRLRTTVSSNDPLVTRNDAAVFLTVSLRQVDRLIADGTLAAVRIGERSIRIRRSALEALLVPVIHGGPGGRPAA